MPPSRQGRGPSRRHNSSRRFAVAAASPSNLPLVGASVEVYAVECRWEPMFTELVRQVGQAVPGTWVIDGDGVVWDPTMVDAATVRL